MAFINQSKNSLSLSNQSKNTASLSNQAENLETFNSGLGYLLTELMGYLLQENGGRIILSDSTNIKAEESLLNQTKNSSPFTNIAKH